MNSYYAPSLRSAIHPLQLGARDASMIQSNALLRQQDPHQEERLRLKDLLCQHTEEDCGNHVQEIQQQKVLCNRVHLLELYSFISAHETDLMHY